MIASAATYIYVKPFSAKNPEPVGTNNNKNGEPTNPEPQTSNTSSFNFNPEETLKNLGNEQTEFSFPKYAYGKSDFKPSIPDYKIAVSELINLFNFEKQSSKNTLSPIVLSESEKQALEQNNFFVAQNNDNFYSKDPKSTSSLRVDDWTDLYGDIGGPTDSQFRAPENSVFVSSDFALHVYHRLLDNEFEYIEQKEFYPRLNSMTYKMLTASIDAYKGVKTDADKESFQRLIAYFAVPDVILYSSYGFYKNEKIEDDNSDSAENVLSKLEGLKPKIPAESFDLAKQEIELVMAADSRNDSPIFSKLQSEAGLDFQEDYTQYGPRSHYGKNPVLRSYFRSMMWYGRQNFVSKSPELTRDAINIVLIMNQLDLMKDWKNIYIPTTFFVGKSDDLGFYDYEKVLSDNKNIPLGDELVSKVQSDVEKLQGPAIMSTLVVEDGVFGLPKKNCKTRPKASGLWNSASLPTLSFSQPLPRKMKNPIRKQENHCLACRPHSW